MIIETIPSGIVILDDNLCIIKMNPAFQEMFMCNNGILGRRISYLVDSEGYEALMSESVELYEAMRTKHNVKYHEILYPLKEEKIQCRRQQDGDNQRQPDFRQTAAGWFFATFQGQFSHS